MAVVPTALEQLLINGEHIAKIAVVFGALLFFAWKAFAGYHVTNMVLNVSCVRQPSSADDKDDLAVSVTLKKGDRGTVSLHDAQFLVWDAQHKEFEKYALHSIDRWSFVTSTLAGKARRKIVPGKQATQIPTLNLTPSDEKTLSGYCQIGSAKIVTIEAVVIGRRFGPRVSLLSEQGTAQWQGAIVSLPLNAKQRSELSAG